MDLPSNPPVSPAVRITVLLRLASEGFQDAFARPAWLEAPPVDLAELREVVGVERIGQLREATGLREGEGYAAGGTPGVVRLAAAAHEGVLGLLGVAALPPDVIIEQTAEGPRYHRGSDRCQRPVAEGRVDMAPQVGLDLGWRWWPGGPEPCATARRTP
jgi:hypothetical protein